MSALASRVLLLMVFIAGTFQDQLNPTSENVCLHSETYNDTVVVKVKQPRTEIKKKKCWKLKKFFQCDSKVTNWVEVDETRVIQRSRIVPKCCSGYEEQAGRCLPVCPKGCIHGACTAPDTCFCAPGFHGSQCDQGIQTTMKPLPTTTASIFATEDRTITNETCSQTTETDLISQINEKITGTTDEPTTDIHDGMDIETSTETGANETLTETSESAQTTAETLPDLSESVLYSEEAVTEIKNDSVVQEEILLEENSLDSEVTEVAANENSVLGLKAESESTGTKSEKSPTSPVDIETVTTVCVLLIFLAAWWLILHKREKFKQVQLEKKQAAFRSEERVKFQAENVFLVCNFSERPVRKTDFEMTDVKPVLKTFKPPKGDEEFMATGRYIC